MIFSVNHTIIDGYTYYSLLSMISADGKSYPMNLVRESNIKGERESDRALGKMESKSVTSTSSICNLKGIILFTTKRAVVLNFKSCRPRKRKC